MISAVSMSALAAPLMASAAATGLEAQTWAGQESSSVLGYVGRRFLTGVGSTVIGRAPAGVTAYAFDPEQMRETLSVHPLDVSPDVQERREAHADLHADRLAWAEGMVRSHLALHSMDTRRTYDRARSQMNVLNVEAREIWEEMAADWDEASVLDPHARHVRIGPRALDRFGRLMDIVRRAEDVEIEWQLTSYGDLMGQLHHSASPPSDRQERRFQEALAEYKGRARAYQEYRQFLLEGARKTDTGLSVNEHTRKKMEQKAFMALWHLHNAVVRIYREQGLNGAADQLSAPLTFVHKTQAYNISRGPNAMVGLEPYLEITWNLRHLVRDAKKGRISHEELDRLAALHWGFNNLVRYYSQFRLAAPDGFPVFNHHRPGELELVQGGLTAFPADGTPSLPAPEKGVVAHFPHTGSLDYAGILGIAYLLGLNPPSIVAEKAFKFIPVMRGFLGMRGVFLDRSKGMDPVYAAMGARIDEGMMVALFGTGTRAYDFPLVSPFANLETPGVLHLPGEYIPSRYMSGMPVRVAEQTGAPLYVFTSNLHRGGIAEPSIPRDLKGFKGDELMFHYARPGEEDGFMALAGIMPPGSLIREDEMAHANAWQTLQANAALTREMEMLAGYRMDAGPTP